ncbi:heme exporter protein D [Alcanivorax hongdengensis A-11-3]|uniref:Heme exporter protein D n=1 Tax=Alcanivorax hongdengensis A-11-3 TaxID=1177179 RepID=L0WA91_9GAMM|nr:heme exporter protein CcmD [Alcanivorax hongdengensis]EKF73894.1 heme exporter protein D [Alcanivorax hongdengensis A-11-3]
MVFDSFADFLAMGGRGVYVWTAYGISAVVIVASMVQAVRQSTVMRDTLARQARRQQQTENTHESGT